MNIQYGYAVVRPEPLVRIELPPPPTPAERFAASLKSAAWTVTVVLGALVAMFVGTLALFVAGLGSMSGVFGIVAGIVAFQVWDSRR